MKNITLKFQHKDAKVKKSHFEILYAIAVKINESIKEKKDLEKIVLCDVPNSIYPDLEKSLLDLLHNSGFPEIKFEKKVDFEALYKQKFNITKNKLLFNRCFRNFLLSNL